MKIRYMKSFVLSLLSALALAACGGGGGGGSPAPASNNPPANPDAFSLSALQSLAPDTLEFSMTGDDDEGIEYTASLNITNHSGDLRVLGKDVTRIQSEFSLTNTTADPDVTSTSTGSSYYASGYELVATTLNTTVTCLPSGYQTPPTSALIGDNGSLVTLTCQDKDGVPTGTTIAITWRLEAGANDEAKFVVTETSYVDSKPNSTEIARYIINKAGAINAIEIDVTNSAGIARRLSGNKA